MTQLSEQIFALHNEGKSYNQIQAELGCSKGNISYHLGAGQKEKTRSRARIKRDKIREFTQGYKQARGCADCKEKYPYWQLDFDHLGDKSFNVSQHHQSTQDIEVVKREVDKCEVVCANCHRNRTHSRSLTTGEGLLDISEFYN